MAGCFCGPGEAAASWRDRWAAAWPASEVLLLLAATDTAAVPGISAAGATPESRRRTAAADAELLERGPQAPPTHALPPLPAGVTPALISHVVLRELGITPLVVNLGCPVAPAVPHLRLPDPAGAGPAHCLSGGSAMEPARVEALLAQGAAWGARPGRPPGAPLLIAECVPGGTTTAQAVLTGLGFDVGGLVSGSLPRPAHALKADLVARGLSAAGLLRAPAEPHPSVDGARARRVLAALGDPMQPLAAALVLGAVAADRPVLLAGGSQMAAVLALALALAPEDLRPRLAALTAVATTAWVASEPHSDLPLLLQRVGERWGLEPLGFAASLRFHGPLHPALADYERGYVKEGVGAGGLALLWEISGRSPLALARLCDIDCHHLHARSAVATPPP
ncbi:MAG: nicotinate-nucleotide--dimethylbenzimidazole phosphoribosyltransferase [Synechococcaceae cyanobacterium]|nr:nicotinate-nucleotide--dimethylbenzimidazole phosphoribosyltransferase [Synechococcaceae cyanobacterium]